jgi:hypothetical protein
LARYVPLDEPWFTSAFDDPNGERFTLHVNPDAVEYLARSDKRYCTDVHLKSGYILTVQGVPDFTAWYLHRGDWSRRWVQSRTFGRLRVLRARVQASRRWGRQATLRGQTRDELAS